MSDERSLMNDNQLPRLAVTGITGLVGQGLLKALDEQREARVFAVEADDIEEHWLDEGHVSELLLPEEMDWPRCSALLVACPELPAWARELPCPVIRLWPETGLGSALVAALQPVVTQLQALAPLTALQLTVLWPMAVKQQPGIEELVQQSASLLNGRGATAKLFPQQVAFNLSLGNLGLAPDLRTALAAACGKTAVTLCEAFTPSFFAVAVSFNAIFAEPVKITQVRSQLGNAGVTLASARKDMISLVADVSGQGGWHGAGIVVDGQIASGWLCGDFARAVLVEPALASWRRQLRAVDA